MTSTGRLSLNEQAWAAGKRALGLPTDKALAIALQISEVTLWRVRTGRAEPGPDFQKAALKLFGADNRTVTLANLGLLFELRP